MEVLREVFGDILRQGRKGFGAQGVQRRPFKTRVPKKSQLSRHNAIEEALLSAGSKRQTAALRVRAATVVDSSHLKSAPDLAIAKEARIQRKSSTTSAFSSCDISVGSIANFASNP